MPGGGIVPLRGCVFSGGDLPEKRYVPACIACWGQKAMLAGMVCQGLLFDSKNLKNKL